MKKLFFLVALATPLFFACQQEIAPEEQDNAPAKSFTFKACLDETKANLSGASLLWAEGDQIGIYVDEPSWEDKNQPFTLSDGAGTRDGEFTWNYTGSFSDNATVAFYPWEGLGSDKNNVYEGTMYFKLQPAYWSYSSGKMLTPLVASLSGSTDNIRFKHAGAAVKVTINNVPAHAHSIGMSVDGQQVNGTFSINPANAGTDAMALVEEPDLSKNSVWLNIWNGSNSAWDFIFPVPELSKPKLSFQMFDENDILVWSANLKAQANDLKRGDLLEMPALDITPYKQFKESTEWSLCGKIGGFDNWDAVIPMYTDGTVSILKGLTFKAGDEFKIRKDGKWDESYPDGGNYVVNEDCTKDVLFNNSTHEITLKDAGCEYPAPKVSLYFGINSSIPNGVAISSSGLGASGWPGVTMVEKETIVGKDYYRYVVDGTTVWGKTISMSIVGIDSWNSNATSICFSTIKSEYYIDAPGNKQNLVLLPSRPTPPAPVAIDIDGDMTDWDDCLTVSTNDSNNYRAFKATYDEDYIYLYTKRVTVSGQSYIYYDFDLDNDSKTGVSEGSRTGLEVYMALSLYNGDSINFNPSAAAYYPSSSVYSDIVCKGTVGETFTETELSIPRSNLSISKGDVIKIYSWGNKSADGVASSPIILYIEN